MPRSKSSKRKIIIAVAIIAIVIVGSVGVYLYLASPTVVFSGGIDTSGLLVSQTFNVTLGFPKSQLQVSFELTFTPTLWSYLIVNATDDVILPTVWPSNSPGTYTTVWLNTPPGLYRIIVAWSGTLRVHITALARGPPFVA